jgi:hypothetical protein
MSEPIGTDSIWGAAMMSKAYIRGFLFWYCPKNRIWENWAGSLGLNPYFELEIEWKGNQGVNFDLLD